MKWLEPLEIGSLRVKNRIVLPPMGTNFASPRGEVNDRHINYYRERARGGVGLIIVESTVVSYPAGRVIKSQLSIHDDGLIPGLRRLAAAIKAEGARAGIELAHSGRMSPQNITGLQPIAPSPIPSFTGELPKEMTVEEIKATIQLFAHAAHRAQRAGFEMVELHAGHGYLLGAFLSPYTNKRNDAYGGDFQGRLRFPLEVIRGIKEINGTDYPVFFRFSGDEYVPGGNSLKETRAIAKALVKGGVDALDISATAPANLGDEPRIMTNRPYAVFGDGPFIRLAKEIKETVSAPVMTVGSIYRPEQVEEILHQGYADLVGIGRGLIAEPEWCNKVARRDWPSVRICLQCNIGCEGRVMNHQDMGCTINPYVGRESERYSPPAYKPRRIAIVGGGPAGLELARTAAGRGHGVMILEKEAALGGMLHLASILPYKHYHRLTDFLIGEVQRLGVEVHLETEASMDSLAGLNPDIVIWAAGGQPMIPEIEGLIGNVRIILATEALKRDPVEGNSVIVIGGGMVGLETAEFLAHRKASVTVLEKLASVGNDLPPMIKRIVLSRLAEMGVQIVTQAEITKIDEGRVYLAGKEDPLNADVLVLATGFTEKNLPIGPLDLGGKTVEFHAIGDCHKPGKVLEAILAGNKLGHSL